MAPFKPDEIKNETNELRLLFEVSQALDGATELADHLDEVLALMARYTGMMRGALYLVSLDGKKIKMEASYGFNSAERKRARYQIGEGVIGRVIADGQAMVVPNVSHEPLFLNRTGARNLQKEEISFICAPIILAGQTIGALSADRLFADSVCLEEDMRLMQVLATLIARAVRIRRDFTAVHASMVEENRRLQAILNRGFNPGPLVGHDPGLWDMLEEVAQAADSNVTVLIRGESGTGKEMVAGLIHENSSRAGHPFVKVNCAALPEGLVESELFGHERGAFTGALASRKGRFEMAHGGTLFLDEVGDMSLAAQAKLLRAIQEKEFERVGGTETLRVDVRLVAATNCNLEALVESGRFRRDLYYRLSVFPLFLPPLRERLGDMRDLADHFSVKYSPDKEHPIQVSKPALKRLMAYDWPGNIRELENVIERATVLCSPGGMIEERHLPPSLQKQVNEKTPASLAEALNALEQRLITEALETTGGHMAQAAAKLGLTERKMGLRMEKYKLDYRKFRKKELS